MTSARLLLTAALLLSLTASTWAQPAGEPAPAAPAVKSADAAGPRGDRPRPRRIDGAINPDGPDAAPNGPGGPGGSGGPGGPGGGPRDNDELSAEQIDEALIVLRDFRPEMAARIEEWRKDDPNRVGRMIAHQLPGIRRLIEARRTDPEGYRLRLRDMQLERQTRQLANQLAEARRNGESDRAEELTRSLRNQVVEHFEVRQQMRERAVVMLEQRIKELREQLQTRAQSRDALIDEQVKRLMPSENGGVEAEW
jgi:hypothetical protein